ncbi:MAG: hypothetical protein WCG99_01520 [Candidatus Berkelbacteria bacterium]
MRPWVALLEISGKLEPFLLESLKLLQQVRRLQPKVTKCDDECEVTTEKGDVRLWAYVKLLKHIAARIGYPTLARLIEYQAKFKLALDDYCSVKIGRQIKAGNYDLVCETTEFVLHMEYPYGTNRLTSYIDGAVKFGLAEIKMGMDLAPPPSETSRRGVLPEYHDPQYEHAQDRFWWGYHTAELGYDYISALASRFRVEGLDERQIISLFYEAETIDRRGRQPLLIHEAANLVANHGLPMAGFLLPVISVLLGRRGTVTEVSAILALSKQNEIESIEERELQEAIQTWRSPTDRHWVVEAFEMGAPDALYRGNQGGKMIILWAVALEEVDAGEVIRNCNRIDRSEARMATQELLLPRYPQMGIFGPEQEIIPELSRNPLIVPAMLKPLAHTMSFGALERRFGAEHVGAAMTFCKGASEVEYRAAIQRIGPVLLAGLLDNVSANERDWVVRSINWHGLMPTVTGIKISRQSELAPAYIPIITEAICFKSKWLYPIHPKGLHAYAIEKLATAEDEHAVAGFLMSSPSQRVRLARAVRLFRYVSARMYFRLKSGYI